MSKWPVIAAAGLTAVLASGCGHKDPLDAKIEAREPVEFASWQSEMSDKLTTEQQHDLSDALQELRFRVMAGGISDAAQVQSALLDRIRDRTLRQVLADGLGLKLQREEKERSDLDQALRYNVASARRPGADALEDRQAQIKSQMSRIEAADKEISRLQARMAADSPGGPSPSPGH